MTGTLQMLINGKVQLSKAVVSWMYVEKVTRDWKEKMLPALTDADSWEIVVRTFQE
jgi:hypothetical protein